MTCIVGLVSGNGSILIGGDSAGIAGFDLTVRKDPKVFVKGDFIYGFTSSFRMGQVLQYKFTPPYHDPRWDVDTYLRTEWIDAVRKAMEAGGYATKNNGQESGGTFLFGYRSRLLFVDSDYQIGEHDAAYDSVGCGHAFAKGAMFALKNSPLPDESKVLLALQCAEQHSAGVRGPHIVKTLPPTLHQEGPTP